MAGPSAQMCTGRFSFWHRQLSSYNKPYLTTDDQIALLQSRGMEITDLASAKACLARMGYYRLSAYWYPNRKSETYTDPSDRKIKVRVLDDFRDGTKFTDALEFYVFDKKLRLIVMDALERIEIGIRTDIAIHLGVHSPWVHRDPNMLHGNFSRRPSRQGSRTTRHDEWLMRLDDKFAKSKEDFAKHFKHKYSGDQPPIWVAVELWDFGTLSHFFSGMKNPDKDAIAAQYHLPDGIILEKWLRTLNDIRNLCAHHSRLWNRVLAAPPPWPQRGYIPDLDHVINNTQATTRFYAAALIIRFLLGKINPTSEWTARLVDHVGDLPTNPAVTLASGGFPQGWDQLPIWN